MKIRLNSQIVAMGLVVIVALSRSSEAQHGTVHIGERELARIGALRAASQEEALRRAIVQEQSQGLALEFNDLVFYHEDQLRPSLRRLFTDPEIGHYVARILALIGAPEDLTLIIQSPPPPGSQAFSNRWAYNVVCSLLHPTSELQWSFLRKCALNGYEDRWVDRGAIQTLKLMASSRSQAILEEVRTQNEYRSGSAMRGIEYIRSNPSPLQASDIEELAARVGQIIRIGDWEGNAKPKYNRTRDKALVDFRFSTGEDSYIYTSTFHHLDGVWKLCGVRETLQAFNISAILNARPLPILIEPPPVVATPVPAPLPEWLQPGPPNVAPHSK
jgi:hypothetical protein